MVKDTSVTRGSDTSVTPGTNGEWAGLRMLRFHTKIRARTDAVAQDARRHSIQAHGYFSHSHSDISVTPACNAIEGRPDTAAQVASRDSSLDG